ncbi:MAG: hypothetical protein GC156_14680 [Actinomycetales bacterium]|nr:hypothetical protein [Actinomycetales bacterium]
MRRGRSSILVLGVSVAMLGAGAWLIVASRVDAGNAVVTSVGSRPRALPSPTDQGTVAGSLRRARSASSVLPAAAPAPPARIVIPAIGVDTDIVYVGLDRARAVEVPEDIREVGWYRHAAAPGSRTGSAVLVAHRDGRAQGHGVF